MKYIYICIYKYIKNNENNKEVAKNILRQQNSKKINMLKYEPNATTQPMAQQEDRVKEKPRNPVYLVYIKM